MGNLISEWFDLWCRERWLKRVGKALDKYNRLNAKTKRQAIVVHALVDKFNDLFHEDLGRKQT